MKAEDNYNNIYWMDYREKNAFIPIFRKTDWAGMENTKMFKGLNSRCSYFRDFLKKAG